MNLTWLHISDIHFHFSSYESLRLREEFLRRIKEISNDSKIDYIFLTGDLADKNGSYSESLIDYLNEVVKAIGVIKENVLIVPGNHDHDRVSTRDILNTIYEYYDIDSDNELSEIDVNKRIDNLTESDVQILESSFVNFKEVCSQFYSTEDYVINHSVVKYTDEDPIIVKINTCLFDRSSNDERKELHIGMKRLLEYLNEADFSHSEMNIAIGHHPTSVLCVEERQRFLDCLKSKDIHFYLCGHKHKPEFIYHNDFDICEIICSYGNSDDYSMGGFSVGRIDTIHNQYYVDFYNWKSGDSWVRDTTIKGCNETGRCYIQGDKYKHIDIPQIAIPIKMYGTQISSHQIFAALNNEFELFPYLSDEIKDINKLDWEKELTSITRFADSIKNIINKQINIFPLAPIPLLISFGFEMQHNSDVTLFQFDRENNRWVNSTNYECPDYKMCWKKKLKAGSSDKLILKICTSTDIFDNQLPKLNKSDIVELTLQKKGLGLPLYENHYKTMLKSLFDEITPKINQYNEIHLFASVPAGMALEIGRSIQKGVFPKVFLYNYYKGYVNTNILNE